MSPDVAESKAVEPPSGARGWKTAAAGIGPALLLALVSLYSTCVIARAGASAPSEADWLAAAEAVRAGLAPGERIVFAPGWIDPLGRRYLGDQMSIEMASPMDSARATGFWELGRDGARSPATAGLTADSSADFGLLRLRHYPQHPAELVFDFTAHYAEAELSGQEQGRPRLGLQEVGFEPHRCVLVVPKPDQTVSLRFPSVPLGTRIVGYAGLADVFTRRDVRDPGRVELFVNDKEAASILAGVDDGWVRFEAETEPTGAASVEIKLTAVGPHALDRRICVAMEARR